MFEYEGDQYTLADLQKSAAEQGYDNFEEFVQMYINNGMKQISRVVDDETPGDVIKDIDTSPAGLFFNVLQETNPGAGKALAVLSDFGANLLRTADQMGDFVETMVEMNVESGAVPGSGIAPYIAKRIAAQQAGVTLEEFDETNPYNIIKLEGLANIFDKATIKYKDPETGQQEDFISLFQKGEYGKAT
jgi:hypothetical protein